MAKQQPAIMIVDDEPAQRRLLGDFLRSLGYLAIEMPTAEEAIEAIRHQPPAMVLLDVRMPGMNGIEALGEIRKVSGSLPVLLVTAYADLRQAVEAMKCGADDYLSKPVDLDELAAAIADAVGTKPIAVHSQDLSTLDIPDGLICESSAMRHVVETAAVVAPSDVPVLITGESGSGKEVIAQLIHRWSQRANQPLVTANCAGLPESLIESELFGHKKGAFTDAKSDRAGFFRAADGGTLFLDEIGELPLHLQPKLLRAIESGEITPLGSEKPISVQVRLIAATNRDLAVELSKGSFREDLYYRINVVELRVPALSERREDIPKLAKQFAAEFAGRPVRLSPQALHCLLANTWTGNVRELRNAIQRACLLCRGDIIMPEHLPTSVAGRVSQEVPLNIDTDRLSQVERATILATLEECKDNRTHAAKKLGISRRALIYKLRELDSPPTEDQH